MMKRLFLIVVVFLIACWGLRAQTTYYVDPSGSDNNPGTSTSSAWKTLVRVMNAALRPGDAVLLKRGEIWRERLEPQASGSPGARIVFGAYGSGPRPVITQRGELPGWNVPSSWTNAGGNLWTFSAGTKITRIFLDGTEYGTASAPSSVDQRFRFHWAGGTLTLYSPGNPASSFSTIEVPHPGNLDYSVLRIRGKSYLSFVSLALEGGENTVECDDGDNLLFDSCEVGRWCGVYGARFLTNSDFGEIRNCLFDSRDTVLHTFNQSDGDLLVLVDANSWDIHHSRFFNYSHGGVGMSTNAVPAGQTITRNRIHHNEFMTLGDYGRAWGCQGGTTEPDACRDNLFYNNWIHHSRASIQMSGRNNRAFYNLIDTVLLAPWSVDALSPGASGFSINNSRAADSIIIDNNVIRNTDSHGIDVQGSATHVIIRNNIVVNCGLRGDYNQRGVPGGGQNVALFLAKDDYPGTALVSNAVVLNNCLFSSATGTPVVVDQYKYQPTVKITASALNAFNGSNGNRIAGNIGGDPGLLPDMKITVGSPCIDAGVDIGLTADYWDQSVPVNLLPDIGAYEWRNGPATTLDTPVLTQPADQAFVQTRLVTLRWNAVAGASAYRVQLGTDQTFSTVLFDDPSVGATARDVTLPAAGAARYFWRVQARSTTGVSLFSAPWSLTTPSFVPPQPPRLLSPPDSSTVRQPVVLRWTRVSDAQRYRVEVSSDGFSTRVVDDTLITDTVRVLPLLTAGTRFNWRLSSRNGGGSGPTGYVGTFVTASTPAAPDLRLPRIGSIVQQPIILRWSPASQADSYVLQIFQNGVTAPVRADSGITDTLRIIEGLAINTGFTWRVGARNVVGAGPWSTSWSFTTGAAVNVPANVFPVDSAEIQPPITFRWTKSPAAVRYVFQLSDNGFATTLLVDSTLVDTFRVVTGLPVRQRFWWRVGAQGLLGPAVFGSQSTLLTAGPPDPPVVIAPGDGLLLTQPLRLVWTRPPSAERFRLQLSLDGFTTTVLDDAEGTDTVRVIAGLRGGTLFSWRVAAVNRYGASSFSQPRTFRTRPADSAASAFVSSIIEQNYPNPFNPATTIQYFLERDVPVLLRVFDILGREVATLVNELQTAGTHLITFDISTLRPRIKGLASGMYFYQFQAADYVEIRKMILKK